MASPSGYRYSPDGQSGSSSLSTHPLKAHACDSSQSMLQDYYVHPQPIKKKKKNTEHPWIKTLKTQYKIYLFKRLKMWETCKQIGPTWYWDVVSSTSDFGSGRAA